MRPLQPTWVIFQWARGVGLAYFRLVPHIPTHQRKGDHGIYLVLTAGFEPAIAWMKTMCPRPLDDVSKAIL